MNFKANETSQKLQGCYYTRPELAAFLTEWVLEIAPRRILEPACGEGVFLKLLGEARARLDRIVACELDPGRARKAKENAKGLDGVFCLHVGDFLQWALRQSSSPPFDGVLGNPPFIRYQYLDQNQQTRAQRLFQQHGLAFTKHTNAWVPFVVASLALLRPGGRLAMVVPAELLHVMHARSLRQFLLQECAKVVVIDPEDLWFKETLQGTVLLLAEKKSEAGGLAKLAIQPVRGRDALHRPARAYVNEADFLPGSALDGKWMRGLLSAAERDLLDALAGEKHVHAFRELAAVDVGIVTGANKFFHVSDAVVEEHQLARWAYPMFGRSEHVRGVIYHERDHAENRRRGVPTNFLWFRPQDHLTARARAYLAQGEADALPRRYKCRIRTPWYSVPSVSTAPVGMLKRCHHFPRLVLNAARVFTTDTAYRVRPVGGIAARDLVFSFVNSLTALSAELEGRHYGGGVLELVPSEIERLHVPLTRGQDKHLAALDRAVRAGVPAEELLQRQDALILHALGIGKHETAALLSAWSRLRGRRQRIAPPEPD